jgi:hypothetical protein
MFSSYLLGIDATFPTKEMRIKPGMVHFPHFVVYGLGR